LDFRGAAVYDGKRVIPVGVPSRRLIR
jgi:hypothetical protein